MSTLPPSDMRGGGVPFYIPATDAPARARRNLKHNDTFAVFDSSGDIGASAGGEDGLFHCDTRHLSHLELLISGSRPLLLHSAVNDENLSYNVDLTNPDIFVDDRIVLLKDTVHLSRTIYLCDGSLRERISLTNHGAYPVLLTLTIAFSSDFADIFEVRGIARPHRGELRREVLDASRARLCYRGLDAVERNLIMQFEPAPNVLHDCVANYSIALEPRQREVLFISATCYNAVPEESTPISFFHGLTSLKRALISTTKNVASVETTNSVVNETLCRSMADLYMLTSATPDGLYPYAGIPWYSTTFGRDGIITALQMLWMDPQIAAGVLTRLARLQATGTDPASDATPGKILHEMRAGEMAALKEVPFQQYYGTVDATPLFVVLAGAYAERTADWETVRRLWPAIEAALAWIDGPGDLDGDGLVEYSRGAETGLANQGWKDSHDAVFHADGRLADGPIALLEVQGYVFAAKQAAAICAKALGLDARALALLEEAERIKILVEKHFWCEDIGFYALALDGNKEPCRVRTSNAGHALWSGVIGRDRGAGVAAALLKTDFFSGWGIRTVSTQEVRYNPMSYHNGSIWPHDNALIARGFARVGEKNGIVSVFEALMRASSYFDQRRIPELFCGFRKRAQRGPTLYPAACSPQAWSAAAPFSLIQSLLGLEFRPEDGEVRLNNPIVPAFLGSITLRNVRLGAASADFIVRPGAKGAALEALRIDGHMRLSLVPGHGRG